MAPYTMGQWIIGLLIFLAIISGVTVNYVDNRWPHAAWIPLAVFAVIAITACIQLFYLAESK